MSQVSDELVDYLLDELDPAERSRIEARLESNDQLRRELDELRPIVTSLSELPDEAWEPLEAPPLVLPSAAPPPSRGPSFLDRLRDFAAAGRVPALGVAAAGLAALAIGVVIGVYASDDESGPSAAETVALGPVVGETGAAGEAIVLTGDDGEQVELDVSGLEPSSPGDAYELWLLNSPEDLVSLGTFTVPNSGETSVRVPLPVAPTEFDFFDISVEPVGGDGSHSGQSVLRGATA